MRLLDAEADGIAHGPLTHTIDLLGDKGVCLAWTPGHPAGHLSVLRTDNLGEVLLVGDAAYTLRKRPRRDPASALATGTTAITGSGARRATRGHWPLISERRSVPLASRSAVGASLEDELAGGGA